MDISYIAINRMVEERMATKKKYRKRIEKSGRIVLSFGRRMLDEELLQKLRLFNVIMDKRGFEKLCKRFLSAEDMSEWVIRKQNLRFEGTEEDWIWICLTVLWERWLPERPSLEMIDDKMQEGYEKLSKNNCAGACKVWLGLWKSILNIMNSTRMKSLNDFNKKFRETQSVYNWVQDLEMELWNAGIQDERFIRDRILFCEGFITRFPHEDSLMIENMKRAIAESCFAIGKVERTQSLYKNWLMEDPRWGWGWIGWSDCYWLEVRGNKDYEKGEKILKEGLSVANVRDREDILDRLADLYSDAGREKEAEEIRRKRNMLQIKKPIDLDDEELTSEEFDGIKNVSQENKHLQGGDRRKIGRNEPYPCGSGKKFKKCCGR